MNNFSFFTAYGGAGLIRGAQIAGYLGAKLNPRTSFYNDICIYVKIFPHLPYPRNCYLDVVDAHEKVEWLKDKPDVNIIAVSRIAKEWISEVTGRKDIVLIPEHHCNFDRKLRPDREVLTVGIIGQKSAYDLSYLELKQGACDLGLNLKWELPYLDKDGNLLFKKFLHVYPTRERVVNFYSDVDIQVTYRKNTPNPKLRNPLKLENAGSFGIPTVAYPEEDYVDEWDGFFIPATDSDEILHSLWELKNNYDYYKEWSKKVIGKAEEYHIEHIAELYKNLN